MKVKTYGVPGLTEWHGKVKAGSIEVSVSFTGGTASPSGAQPAYFMTKDPIVQLVIENSKEFKSGFIILVMSQDIAGEHSRMAIQKPAPAANQPAKEEPITPVAQTPSQEHAPAKDNTTDENAQDDAEDGAIRVADKSEAIEYLKEHFADKGYTATKLRTQGAFEAACKECGVLFVFTA